MHDHVIHYFHGERREMFALGFLFVVRDSFSEGLAVTVAISALLLAGTAGSLLARDASLSRDVISGMKSGVVEKAVEEVEAERSRIGTVISKYKFYRYGAAGLGLLAALLIVGRIAAWLGSRRCGRFASVGNFAQVLIDHLLGAARSPVRRAAARKHRKRLLDQA